MRRALPTIFLMMSGCGVVTAPIQYAQVRHQLEVLIIRMESVLSDLESVSESLHENAESDRKMRETVRFISGNMAEGLAALLNAAKKDDGTKVTEALEKLTASMRALKEFNNVPNPDETCVGYSVKRLRESAADARKALADAKSKIEQ